MTKISKQFILPCVQRKVFETGSGVSDDGVVPVTILISESMQ